MCKNRIHQILIRRHFSTYSKWANGFSGTEFFPILRDKLVSVPTLLHLRFLSFDFWVKWEIIILQTPDPEVFSSWRDLVDLSSPEVLYYVHFFSFHNHKKTTVYKKLKVVGRLVFSVQTFGHITTSRVHGRRKLEPTQINFGLLHTFWSSSDPSLPKTVSVCSHTRQKRGSTNLRR